MVLKKSPSNRLEYSAVMSNYSIGVGGSGDGLAGASVEGRRGNIAGANEEENREKK